jgi:hypothetical protein
MAPDSIWAERPLGEGGRTGWRVGPLRLWIERRGADWRTVWQLGEDPLTPGSGPLAGEPPDQEPGLQRSRWTGGQGDRGLRLRPLLPDRALVYRPQQPVFVLGGDQARVFLSVPIRVTLELRPSGRHLGAWPCQRLSDTWFGTTTQDGELCYASRTTLRQLADELPALPQRATCAVTIRNEAADALELVRLRLPTDLLGLHERGGRLLTEDLLLVREAGRDLTEIRTPGTVEGRPAGPHEPLCRPRRVPEAHSPLRELQAIFGR